MSELPQIKLVKPLDIMGPYIQRVRELGYTGFVRLSVAVKSEAQGEFRAGQYWAVAFDEFLHDNVMAETWEGVEAAVVRRVNVADCDPVFMGF